MALEDVDQDAKSNNDPNLEVDLDQFAHQHANLYHTPPDETLALASPIYHEISHLKDRYTQAEEIAQGGMKSIKKVFDTSASRYLALAELKEDVDASFHEIFLREARLTAMLDHPNIISVHDIGVTPDGRPYFTMDLKPGNSLSRIIQSCRENESSKYPRNLRLQILDKILGAVSYAHARNVIHLDLKPDNIQVGEFGEVLLCDWGLAKIVSAGDQNSAENDIEDIEDLLLNRDLLNHMTFNGEIKGTPGYMSPEQINKGGIKDKASDIYALGAMLYELCLLKPPVISQDPQVVLDKTVRGELGQMEGIPASLAAIIKRAMQLDPANRYTSVKAMQADLNHYLSGYAPEALEAGPFKELAFFIKRNQKSVIFAALSLFLIFALSIYFLINLNKKNQRLAHQQQRASYVAEQFRLAQQKKEQYSLDLESQYWHTSVQTSDHYVYQDPVKALDEAVATLNKLLSLNPDKYRAQTQLAYCHFIRQEFHLTMGLYRKEDDIIPDLFQIAEKYAPLTASGRKLTIDELVTLFGEFDSNRRSHLILKLARYDRAFRDENVNYIKPVRALLKYANDAWDQTGVAYKHQTGKCHIRNPQIKKLRIGSVEYHDCLLNLLNVTHLNLRGSGVYNLGDLVGMKITSLDIRETNIINLEYLNKLPNLKTLFVHNDQFTQAQLDVVPVRIRVTKSRPGPSTQ